jgi:hypothetical protein
VTRLISLLLWLYPAAFRRRYGAELEATIAEDSRDPRNRGLARSFRFTASVTSDVVTTALRQRRRQLANAFIHDNPRLPEPPKRTQMDTLLQDLRYAFRQFVHRPAFTAVAVLSLALAIGGNSLIYGMLDGFRLSSVRVSAARSTRRDWRDVSRLSSETTYVEALSPADTWIFEGVEISRTSDPSILETGTSPAAMFPSGFSRRCCSTICFPSWG